jgi:hypothetical protein
MSVIDSIRPAVWDNELVAMWYAQNCLLFATSGALEAHPSLAAAEKATMSHQLDLIHPSLFLYHRLGLRYPAARVPLEAATGWNVDGEATDLQASESELPNGSVDADASPVPMAPLGLRVLLNELPMATRRAFRAKWGSLRHGR